ncbi:hypothetical protein ONS95_012153 [Cadophora gregata]|uniref:uncharacterized protein n=1 Tax=Cadophora gregata TaxID=51156 RepID=UPI0026DB3355|nr:uncharacterized protein ONS95_012153 [Cadophora gregata]KAK0117829.1 hypothetical protein ONS95_012153 [Cadophora gregata]KAK0122884.1 hypothetical protein ONS96_009910 [Cadophora gregata f. sp. sojae]
MSPNKFSTIKDPTYKNGEMATISYPNSGTPPVDDASLMRHKAVDILFRITATELRILILEFYFPIFLNTPNLSIRCPLLTILQERSQKSDPELAEQYKILYDNALAIWEKTEIEDLTFYVPDQKASNELNSMSRVERHTIKHLVFSPMVPPQSSKITVSNSLETVCIRYDEETDAALRKSYSVKEVTSRLGESKSKVTTMIAACIAHLVRPFEKTLKKLTFESQEYRSHEYTVILVISFDEE